MLARAQLHSRHLSSCRARLLLSGIPGSLHAQLCPLRKEGCSWGNAEGWDWNLQWCKYSISLCTLIFSLASHVMVNSKIFWQSSFIIFLSCLSNELSLHISLLIWLIQHVTELFFHFFSLKKNCSPPAFLLFLTSLSLDGRRLFPVVAYHNFLACAQASEMWCLAGERQTAFLFAVIPTKYKCWIQASNSSCPFSPSCCRELVQKSWNAGSELSGRICVDWAGLPSLTLDFTK